LFAFVWFVRGLMILHYIFSRYLAAFVVDEFCIIKKAPETGALFYL